MKPAMARPGFCTRGQSTGRSSPLCPTTSSRPSEARAGERRSPTRSRGFVSAGSLIVSPRLLGNDEAERPVLAPGEEAQGVVGGRIAEDKAPPPRGGKRGEGVLLEHRARRLGFAPGSGVTRHLGRRLRRPGFGVPDR